APVSIPAGGTPNAVAVGDVTGDGLPDALVTRPMPFDAVGVMAGDGTGGFSAPTDVPVLDPTGPAVIGNFGGAVAFVVPRLPSSAIQIVSRNAGVLSPGPAVGVATPADVAAGDVTGDGAPDLVAQNGTPDSLAVLRNQGIPRARGLDFGQQLRRTLGPVTELTVSNDGAAPLRMSSAVVSGTNASAFTTVAN